MSKEQKEFLRKEKSKKIIVLSTQILLFISFIVIWQILANEKIINTFITSSPLNIVKTIKNLYIQNNLFVHIYVTFKETIIAFTLTSVISLIISIILYNYEIIAKILDPYLTIFSSLPKVALGPIIIIWLGANNKSIIATSILISIIVSIQNIYTGFINSDKLKIKLLKTFNASKKDILFHLVLPSNKENIINTLKINISLCLVGVIMGEFLTSKAGIGYLILYGSQVFNLNLVMSGIFILMILSIFMYSLVSLLNRKK